MKLRSRGLGRKELVMDFRRYDIQRKGDEVLITGTITQPVTWDFSIRIERDDIPGLVRVARSKPMIWLFFSWLGQLRKRNKTEIEETIERSGSRAHARVSHTLVNARPKTVGLENKHTPEMPDRAERRRKIEEARRSIRASRRAHAGGPSKVEPLAVGASKGRQGWNSLRVGAIPSGTRTSLLCAAGSRSEHASRSDEKIASTKGPEVHVAAAHSEWKIKRPGAVPKT